MAMTAGNAGGPGETPGPKDNSPQERTPILKISDPDHQTGNSSPPGRNGAASVRLSLSGEMDARKLPGMFRDAAEKLRRTQAGSVEIDASQLHCGDSTCLALLAEIRREAARTGGKVSVVGAGPDLQALIDLATLGNPLAPELRPPPPLGIVAGVGATVANALKELRALVAFFGELCAAFAWAAVHPRQVRWRNFVAGCESAGANAAIVVMVLGFLIGVMLAFQSAEQTEKYGVRTVVASVVAIAVTRELGPLITALLLAGRTASALAAEMGTMKIDDELNALRVMGLDPVRFLAIPQVLAVVVVTPLLTAICDGAGILGGYSVMADHGTTFIHYIVQVRDSLHAWDVFGGMLKTTICGLVIAMVGCLRGIRSGDGPRAVGHSTTSAVVISILLVVAIDGAFGVVYYYLGV